MTRKKRDVYKNRLYAAEDVLFDAGNVGRVFEDIKEVQQFVATVQSIDPLFKGMTWISVRRAHGNAKASWADFEDNILAMSAEHMNEQAVLHELAHFLTSEDVQYHGREFCWNYLDLVLRWRGPSVYVELRDQIRAQGLL